jgi:hypothetical protein
MFTEFWKSLGGAFDKRWLIDVFGPALLVWGAGLWVWMQITGVSEAVQRWQGYSSETQTIYGVAGFLLVVLTALLLEAFEGGILRVYEGYRPWIQALADRRAEGLRRKQARQRALKAKQVRGTLTPRARAALGRINAHLRHRPKDPARSMPTFLGDILRTAEDYPRARYGLDAVTLWPRLYPHLSATLCEALGAAQAQLDLALRLTTLTLLYGVAGSVAAAATGAWLVLTWTLPALPLAWLLWRSAHPAAMSYAGLLRSAFDLHRGDVYDALRWPTPASPDAEVAAGQRMMVFLTHGVHPEGMVYADVEPPAPEPAAPEPRPRSLWAWLVGRRRDEA